MSLKTVPLSPTVLQASTFFPQSIAVHHGKHNLEDHDVLTPMTTYCLRPHERLEVGKYVPDPTQGKDPAGPKYGGESSASARTAHGAAGDEAAGKSGDGTDASHQDDDADFEDEGPTTAAPPAVANDNVEPLDLLVYRVVRPAAGTPMVGSLFFPVHYGPPTAKDKQDPRGLPYTINATLYPNDRADVVLDTLGVKAVNLNKLMLFKIGPGAVAFRVVICAFEAAGMKYTPSNKYFNILWAKRATPAMLGSLLPYQKINHFPGAWGIGRKDSLAANVGRMKRQYGAAAFQIVPASFILPKEKEELAQDLQDAVDRGGPVPTYIVKPSASSCGRGIKLYKGMPPMPKSTGKTFVCQRYIGNPFLVRERKFDLRMYCVVTGFDPLKIYLFDEGLVRFAAERYPGADKGLENTYMHLTNYSVSKTAELSRASKGKCVDETDDPVDIKWCISDFRAWLCTTHGTEVGQSMWSRILADAHDVIVKMFLSIEAEVVAKMRTECSDPTGRNCFELYGLDLMVDSDLNVKLIEVNIMPSLATGTTLDKAVKGRMLAHMLTLVRPVPYCRDAVTSSKDGTVFTPSGPYIAGGGAERYYFPTVRGAPRGSVERNNVPLLTKFNNSAVKESCLSPQETLMLMEADEEMRCSGGFSRVYPTAKTSRYFPYFTQGVSRNNFLLASWMEQRERFQK